VGAQKIVAVGERCGHPPRLGLIDRAPEERIEPDEPVAAPAQTGHLASKLIGVSSVPPVADDDDDGAVTEHPAGVVTLKRVERVGDARASADVVDLGGHVLERSIDVAVPEEMRDSGQMCRKREGLDALAPADRMREDEQMARVPIH
jgi:hypothetical protein